MTTTSIRRTQIASSLRDKEYRDLLVSEQIDSALPIQIRAMRQDRTWSQKELADRVGMTQEGVSRLESLNYGKFTLKTLKRLASAFDVALAVRFVPFSDLVDRMANLSPEDLAVPDFDHDPGLRPVRDVALSVQGNGHGAHPVFGNRAINPSDASAGVPIGPIVDEVVADNVVWISDWRDWQAKTDSVKVVR